MKSALAALGLMLLVAAGCQNKKSNDSVTDLNSPTPVTNTTAAPVTPVAYTPAPQASMEPANLTATPGSSSAAAAGNTYTVKPGDTLWKIAASHYGDGKKWKQIADANPGLTPQKLKVGQTITLP